MRLAFEDLHCHCADPASMTTSSAELLNPVRLQRLADQIDHKVASSRHIAPKSSGTVYLCTADKDGRMVSFIQSNYRGFGSGLVVPGTGIALNNRASGFVVSAGHPNAVDGAKLPSHSILPGFLFKDGKPLMAFGVMGGNMQSQGHLQVLIHSIIEGLNPQASSDAPRWRIDDRGHLIVEAAMPHDRVEALRRMGHELTVMPEDSIEFGSAQLVRRLPDASIAYVAGSEHRRDGQAVGC